MNTNHIPRCPFCYAIMEEVQLKYDDHPASPGMGKVWLEVWGCSSCHTNHVFPARLEFLEKVRGSQLLERSNRILYLPRGVG